MKKPSAVMLHVPAGCCCYATIMRSLREAGKLDEARTLFDLVARSTPDRPEAWDAALRAGQCQKQAAEKQIADGRRQLANAGLKPEQHQAAERLISEGAANLRAAAAYLNGQEQQLRNRKPAAEDQQKTLAQVRGRALYEAAWALRTVADLDVEAARHRMQLDRWEKLRADVARATAPGQTPPAVGLPEVDLRDVPVQSAENLVRTQYRSLIATFPELIINADARFELAELLAARNEHDEAVKLLQVRWKVKRSPPPNWPTASRFAWVPAC